MLGTYPKPLWGKAPTGDQTVEMRMVHQVLSPSVEKSCQSKLSVELLKTKLQESVGCGVKKQGVELLLVLKKERSRKVLGVDVEKAERTLNLLEALLADMAIASGGGEVGVAQEMLDDGNLGMVLQEMGREAVTKTVYAARSCEFGTTERSVKEVLPAALRHG